MIYMKSVVMLYGKMLLMLARYCMKMYWLLHFSFKTLMTIRNNTKVCNYLIKEIKSLGILKIFL